MLKKVILCYKNALLDTINQEGIEHAGYLSFLSMLAIFPFFIIITATLSLFLDSQEGNNLVNFIQQLLSDNDFTRALTPRLSEIIENPPDSFLGLAFISII